MSSLTWLVLKVLRANRNRQWDERWQQGKETETDRKALDGLEWIFEVVIEVLVVVAAGRGSWVNMGLMCSGLSRFGMYASFSFFVMLFVFIFCHAFLLCLCFTFVSFKVNDVCLNIVRDNTIVNPSHMSPVLGQSLSFSRSPRSARSFRITSTARSGS